MLFSLPRARKTFVFLSLSAFLLGGLAPSAEAKTHHHVRHHRVHHHGAPVASSAGYADIVIDEATGQVVHATAPDQLRHPASLTKMMTLYLAFQEIATKQMSLNQYLPISANAAAQSPSKLGLRAGQRIRVEDALLGVVTESANDAAVVLGEWMGGSEEGFAEKMNQQALALGMKHTHFQNPSGLPDPDQVTTARDMATLGRALIENFPQFYPYFSHDSFTYAGLYHHNHNHLMDRYDGMDGIKTGYIRASGFNLVASAKHGNTRLIGVVFGGKSAVSRDNLMAQLLDASFVRVAQLKRSQPALAQNGAHADDAQGDAADPSPVAPAPVTASPAPTPSAWGVQIGTYTDADVAQQALASARQSLPDLLAQARAEVQPVKTGEATSYRARFTGFDQGAAQSLCAALTKQGQSCLILTP